MWLWPGQNCVLPSQPQDLWDLKSISSQRPKVANERVRCVCGSVDKAVCLRLLTDSQTLQQSRSRGLHKHPVHDNLDALGETRVANIAEIYKNYNTEFLKANTKTILHSSISTNTHVFLQFYCCYGYCNPEHWGKSCFSLTVHPHFVSWKF